MSNSLVVRQSNSSDNVGLAYRKAMSQTLRMPFKSGGSLALTIDSEIVKELEIDQGTLFSQEVLDNGVFLRIRKLKD
jgi:hypothetical protein